MKGAGCRVQGLWFGVDCSGLRVWGLGGSGFRFEGLRLRVESLGLGCGVPFEDAAGRPRGGGVAAV